jgi:hypothetical protein
MSRVGRLAGAILAESAGDYFLVGNLKRPCDFPAAGFEKPAAEIDALARPYVRLARSGPLVVPGPWLEMSQEGEVLLQALSARLLIERNGSVSDRLWRLILSNDPDAEPDPGAIINARWLGEVPGHLWHMVRETVLKCV